MSERSVAAGSKQDPAAPSPPPPPNASAIEEPPPFLGSWRNVYLFVLGELAVTVTIFYALARWAS